MFVHVKPPVSAVTVSPNVCVLAAGAPVVMAETVTMNGPPTGVPAAAVTVNVSVTGVEDVGLTELDGENTQAAPVGNPAEQLSVTVPEKLPAAVTWNVLAPDVPPCPTVSEFGLGAVRLKSTTCSVTVASTRNRLWIRPYRVCVETVVAHGSARCHGVGRRRSYRRGGFRVQVAGAAPAQLKFTGLEYPFCAVSVPSNVAVCVGNTVCGEFEITFV